MQIFRYGLSCILGIILYEVNFVCLPCYIQSYRNLQRYNDITFVCLYCDYCDNNNICTYLSNSVDTVKQYYTFDGIVLSINIIDTYLSNLIYCRDYIIIM